MIQKTLLLGIWLSLIVTANGFAQAPSTYYDSAEGLTGYELKTALHNIIDNHSDQGYSALYNGYVDSDSDNYFENDGTVLDMYSENPDGADPYNYTHGNNQCGNYQNEGDCYNREHLFPQGFFNEASPMKSDIHHVVPSDGKVNGMRGNYPFGETDSPSWTSQNGSKRGSCSYPGYSGTIFEPINEFKGDIARALFYFVTRYEDQLSSFDPGNSNNPLDGSSDQSFEQWHLNMLIEWHQQDPVSQREIDRNNAAYEFQGNRNPYIDHPEWVECVWLGNCNTLQFTSDPVATAQEGVAYNYNITAEGEAGATLTIACPTQPAWLTFNQTGNETAMLSGTPGSAQTGSHEVSLSLTDGSSTVYQNFNITVSPAGEVTIFNKDFEDQSLTSGGWTSYSINGSQEWEVPADTYGHNDSYCGYMNGYDGGAVANEDWFVSPAFNPNDYETLSLSFWNTSGYDGPELEAFYSLNYTGNPATTSWTALNSINWHDGATFWEWTFSGDIDLTSLSGTEARVAFKYTSTSSAAATWEIDDIVLSGTESVNTNDFSAKKIKLYPNPASNYISLSGIKPYAQISIYGIDGRLIRNATAQQAERNILIDDLSPGIYFISVRTENLPPASFKFIKE